MKSRHKPPAHQTKPSTPPSKAESKTARPAKNRRLDTPMTPFSPLAKHAKGKQK